MPSFFEKLKKGMGEQISEKKVLPKNNFSPPKDVKKESQKVKVEIEPEKPKTEKEKKEQKEPFAVESIESQEKWFEAEGQLAVDVYQTDSDLVIQSAIAGIKPKDIDISIESDIVLIRGKRTAPAEGEEKNYFYQECYWGLFSRQIILPEETDPSRAKAEMKDGVLIIRIPKIERMKKRKVEIKE